MRKDVRWLLAGMAVLVLAPTAFAVVNFNLTGQGARAMGMGGAFIALADDATAISWNPGGLAQLDRAEISAVGKLEFNSSGWYPKSFTRGGRNYKWVKDDDDWHLVGNFASVVIPLKIKQHNLALAVAYQQQLDFFRAWQSYDPDVDTLVVRKGELSTISPGLAFQITPDFAVGGAMNFWMRGANTKTIFRDSTLIYPYTLKQPYSGKNFVFGLWAHKKPVKFGAVLRTPVTLKYHFEFDGNLPPGWVTRYPSGDECFKQRFPLMYGFGMAVEPNQNFTLSGDIDIRPYSSMVYYDSLGEKDTLASQDIKNCTQFRVGMEYVIVFQQRGVSTIMPLRLGFRTDPRTYTGTIVDALGAEQSDDKQVNGPVFSFGMGMVYPKFQVDFADEFGWTNEPYEFNPNQGYNPSTFKYQQMVMRMLMSAIIRF